MRIPVKQLVVAGAMALLVFLTKDGVLHVVDGASGNEKARAKPPVPKGAKGWELALVADFRGKGDRDLLLQATNKDGYRMGRYLAAYAFESLPYGGRPLWTTDAFVSCDCRRKRIGSMWRTCVATGERRSSSSTATSCTSTRTLSQIRILAAIGSGRIGTTAV